MAGLLPDVTQPNKITPIPLTPIKPSDSTLSDVTDISLPILKEPLESIVTPSDRVITTDLSLLTESISKTERSVDSIISIDTSIDKLAKVKITTFKMNSGFIISISEKNLEDLANGKIEVKEFFKIHAIDNEAVKIEIANHALAINPLIFCQKVAEYGIKDQNALIKMAELIIENCSDHENPISEYIQNFGILDEVDRAHIAELAINQSPIFLSSMGILKNYKISDPSTLLDLAKTAITSINTYVSKNPEFSMLIIQSSSSKMQTSFFTLLLQNFLNLGIIGEESRITLAKLFLKTYPTIGISEYIIIFDISDKKQLFEIAKIDAQFNLGFSSQVSNYNFIESELLVLAKIAAHYHPEPLSKNIKNFKIKDEKDLIEVVRIAASTYKGFSDFRVFGIKDKKIAMEIVKIMALNKNELNQSLIESFDIETEQEIIEIVKIAAKTNGIFIANEFKNFKIVNTSAKFEIAKLLVQKYGFELGYSIKNFDIKDEMQLSIIFLEAYKVTPDLDKYYECASQFKASPKILLILELVKGNNLESIRKFLDSELTDHFSPEIFIELKKLQTSKISDDKQKFNNSVAWLLHTAGLMIVNPPKRNDPKLLEKILKYPDPAMRYVLSQKVINMLENLEKLTIYQNYISLKGSPIEHLRIPALFFYQTDTSYKLKNHLLKARDFLRDGPILKGFLEAISLFEKNFTSKQAIFLTEQIFIQPDKKIEIDREIAAKEKEINELKSDKTYKATQLAIQDEVKEISKLKKIGGDELLKIAAKEKKIIELKSMKIYLAVQTKEKELLELRSELNVITKDIKRDILKKIFALQGIINCGGKSTILKHMEAPMAGRRKFNIDEIYKNTFQSVLPIKGVENFSERFMETFGKREPSSAILTYLGSLKKLPSFQVETAINTLEIYVQSVLDGSFLKNRNTVEPSSHLFEIFNARKDIKDKWFEPKILTLSSALTNVNKNLIKNAILADHHLNEDNFPVIYEFLRAESLEKQVSIKTNLEEKLKTDSPDKKNLLLQKVLIEFFQSEGNLETLKIVEEQLKSLGMKEFVEIVSSLNENTEKLTLNTKGWTCESSDDFLDLLFCGTDVKGSCQNIAGSPIENKCLLAYLLDGKNRLLAIKNSSGKIIARSIFRLLWDKGAKQPALMQERAYPKEELDPILNNILNQFAIDEAKRLNLPLYIESTEISSDLTILQSKGGKGPWEYVDSAQGVFAESIFEITSTEKIYDPIKK